MTASSRDFTFVDDVVRLNLLAADSPRAPGNVYNGGTGSRRTLNEVWALLQKIESVQITPIYAPPRAGDVKHSQAELTVARRDLGYEPRVSFEEGLRRTLQWYRETR